MQANCVGVQHHRKAVTSLVICCSQRHHRPGPLQQLVSTCALSAARFWCRGAPQYNHHHLLDNSRRCSNKWQQSFCIGAGAGAVVLGGTGGGNGPPSSSGWGSGGDGHGWGPAPGSSSTCSNVLAEVAAAEQTSEAAVEEVVLLDVGGMKCGGCVGHVRQVLEQHPAVTSATVNLATETALVRVTLAPGADLAALAAELAKALTAAGFPAAVSKKAPTAAAVTGQ